MTRMRRKLSFAEREISAARDPKLDVSRAARQQLGIALDRKRAEHPRLSAPMGK
jgi:hypothetical protein